MHSFDAIVEPAGRGGHVVVLPPELADALPAKHLLRVRGTLDDAEFRSNLVKSGSVFYLGVHKATLQAAGRATGDTVSIELEIDPAPRA